MMPVNRKTMGIDLGDKWSDLCLLDEGGEVVERKRIRTTREGFRKEFETREPLTIGIEVGTHSPWVSGLFEGLGHDVAVANAQQLRAVLGGQDKSDRIDAELHARLLRADPRLLRRVRHRTLDQQLDMELLRARHQLVRARTGLINHVRGADKPLGYRAPYCTAEVFHRKAPPALPADLLATLQPILETIGKLTEAIKGYDKKIAKLVKEKYPVAETFQQPFGVGPVTSLAFILLIHNPRRFSSSRKVGAYFGMRPRKWQSGARDLELRISKSGSRFGRQLLIQCAQRMLWAWAPDSDLKRWGLALAARGKKKAVVAVARKLAVLLHRLWVSGEVYEPLRNANKVSA